MEEPQLQDVDSVLATDGSACVVGQRGFQQLLLRFDHLPDALLDRRLQLLVLRGQTLDLVFKVRDVQLILHFPDVACLLLRRILQCLHLRLLFLELDLELCDVSLVSCLVGCYQHGQFRHARSDVLYVLDVGLDDEIRACLLQ